MKLSKERWFDLGVLAVFVAIVLFSALVVDRRSGGRIERLSVQNCLAIENLKAGQREAAQATIDGNNELLRLHDEEGIPLPVPRAAVEKDIDDKQAVVDRFPPRPCGDR